MAVQSSLLDAGRDLALGSRCVGCDRAGRVLCRSCAATLPRGGVPAWPSPVPPGLAPPMAGGEYDGLLKVLVIEHKEHGVFALARPLGAVLADVAFQVVGPVVGRDGSTPCATTGPTAGPTAGPVLLVPVPSRSSVVRRRGHDPLLRASRHAAVLLRRRGVPAVVARLLVPAGRVRDQAGLDARERSENLAGSLRSRTPAPRLPRHARVLVLDDVITTGSTAREAQRALEAAGVPVLGVVAVAATRRRLPRPEPLGPSPPE